MTTCTARVDYKGHHAHGRILTVVGERDVHGVACVILDDDGHRLALPAANVARLKAGDEATGGPRT